MRRHPTVLTPCASPPSVWRAAAIGHHPVLAHWGLVHPRTREELYELLTSDRMEPYTILWLNEFHNYISGPSGQTVAAELHAQLTNQNAVRPLIG